jgi:hypothetical protein
VRRDAASGAPFWGKLWGSRATPAHPLRLEALADRSYRGNSERPPDCGRTEKERTGLGWPLFSALWPEAAETSRARPRPFSLSMPHRYPGRAPVNHGRGWREGVGPTGRRGALHEPVAHAPLVLSAGEVDSPRYHVRRGVRASFTAPNSSSVVNGRRRSETTDHPDPEREHLRLAVVSDLELLSYVVEPSVAHQPGKLECRRGASPRAYMCSCLPPRRRHALRGGLQGAPTRLQSRSRTTSSLCRRASFETYGRRDAHA